MEYCLGIDQEKCGPRRHPAAPPSRAHAAGVRGERGETAAGGTRASAGARRARPGRTRRMRPEGAARHGEAVSPGQGRLAPGSRVALPWEGTDA